MHVACVAAKAASGKPGAGGKGAPVAGAPPPPGKPLAGAAAAPAGVAAGGAKKGGNGAGAPGAAPGAGAAEAAAVQVSQADEDSALASLQWVMSSRPDATVAGQQLKDAWARVSVNLRLHETLQFGSMICTHPCLHSGAQSRTANQVHPQAHLPV